MARGRLDPPPPSRGRGASARDLRRAKIGGYSPTSTYAKFLGKLVGLWRWWWVWCVCAYIWDSEYEPILTTMKENKSSMALGGIEKKAELKEPVVVKPTGAASEESAQAMEVVEKGGDKLADTPRSALARLVQGESVSTGYDPVEQEQLLIRAEYNALVNNTGNSETFGERLNPWMTVSGELNVGAGYYNVVRAKNIHGGMIVNTLTHMRGVLTETSVYVPGHCVSHEYDGQNNVTGAVIQLLR